jgi:hypothetical protein
MRHQHSAIYKCRHGSIQISDRAPSLIGRERENRFYVEPRGVRRIANPTGLNAKTIM